MVSQQVYHYHKTELALSVANALLWCIEQGLITWTALGNFCVLRPTCERGAAVLAENHGRIHDRLAVREFNERFGK